MFRFFFENDFRNWFLFFLIDVVVWCMILFVVFVVDVIFFINFLIIWFFFFNVLEDVDEFLVCGWEIGINLIGFFFGWFV